MQHTPPIASFSYTSIFDQHFDVVVIGAGFIGFSAAREWVSRGAKVALIEPTGDILWEAVRALENATEELADNQSYIQWRNWLQPLQQLNAVNHGYFDTTHAEIIAAQEILKHAKQWSMLINAVPAAVTMDHGRIAGLTVACKSGLKQIRGSYWVDASETGLLASVCGIQSPSRQPTDNFYSIALQSHEWGTETIGGISEYLQETPGAQWLRSARDTERRLRIPASDKWWNLVPSHVRTLRKQLPHTKFIVSHIGLRTYPIYHKTETLPILTGVDNLYVLSPRLVNDPLFTLRDRFMHGLHTPTSVPQYTPATPPILAIPQVTREVICDVLVAGSGTAGSVAAIAAAREGTSVHTIELASFAGGIGTGGGISSYFAGNSGGIQEQIDRDSMEMSILLCGNPSYWRKYGRKNWHHDAKKLVLQQYFEQSGVQFDGNTLLYAIERDSHGHVSAAYTVCNGEVVCYRAKTFIDSTGDGDLCVLAGAQYSEGRPGDSRALCYSQVAMALISDENQWMRPAIMNVDSGWVDATDPEDLTRARLEGIFQHLHSDWDYPSRPIIVSPLLGIRQSRNIETDYSLSLTDLLSGARFADTLGMTYAYSDTHSVDFEFESDRMFFYMLVCRCTYHPLYAELPYRMLLPKGLKNVWVACRAAGIEMDATYSVRMQRDMQRLGEAAGIAAAFCAQHHRDARNTDMKLLQQRLQASGALQQSEHPRFEIESGQKRYLQRTNLSWNEDESLVYAEDSADTAETLLEKLDQGKSGLHIWKLAHMPEMRDCVAERLTSPDQEVSFYAAAILGYQDDGRAEPRLLQAIKNQEQGASYTRSLQDRTDNYVDIPTWLQAAGLLRICGSEQSIPVLADAAKRSVLFNVATLIALTCEKLIGRVSRDQALKLLNIQQELLSHQTDESAKLPVKRSMVNILAGQKVDDKVRNWGVDTSEDHLWQLHLIIARSRKQLGMPLSKDTIRYFKDYRAYVRRAFESVKGT
jgi:hypothetical protein